MSDAEYGGDELPQPRPRRKMMIFMVNLAQDETGVEGIIHITTLRGSQGPSIAWYPSMPDGDTASVTVTIEAKPRSMNNGVDAAQWQGVEPAMLRWVVLNHADLLDFWNLGAAWPRGQVHDFIDRLRKLP